MWWGVAAALSANVLYSAGFVLEKRALSAMPRVSVRRPGRLLRLVSGSPLWICGALALAAGFAAQLVVYRTLPMAAAQGLFVSGLVLLVLLSARLLGERTTRRERWALAAILGALLMVVLSLDRGGETVGAGASYPLVLVVCGPCLSVAVALYVVAERRSRRGPPSGVVHGVAVGLVYGVSSLAIKGLSGHQPTDGGWGAVVPVVLRSPYPYLLLVTGALGLVMSQVALQRCRASLIVPVCTTVSCLYAAVVGTLAFGEALPEDPALLALRLGGTLLGLVVLLTLPAPGPDSGAPVTAKELTSR
ncbi:DMT family transporter [Streptomyces sp. ZYX-F-203]